MKKIVLSVFVMLLMCMTAWGQNAGFITLYGHVSDVETSESLDYASVNLSGTSVNIVSNSDGFFSLKIPVGTSVNTDVLVSFLGYRTGTVKVSDFDGYTSDKPLEIRLTPTSILLDPVTVRSNDPVDLVKSALYKIKDNYPTDNVGMTAFYREMIRKGTTKYLALNEAVIDIDKSSYTGFASDKVAIYKGRGSVNYDSSDTIFVKFQGGITTALQLDQARYPFAGVTPDEVFEDYDFFMSGVESYDGYTFYKVGFRPSGKAEIILFKGYIFIEVENLAIGRIEMEMDLTGREEEAAGIFIRKSPQNLRSYANSAKYVISYKCFDGKWYYDYCRADLSFTTRRRNSLFRNTFNVTEEMAVTDHKETAIAIEKANRIKFKDVLSDKVADFADDNFWEDYNIIEPDQSIDAIVRKIVRQLGRRK